MNGSDLSVNRLHFVRRVLFFLWLFEMTNAFPVTNILTDIWG